MTTSAALADESPTAAPPGVTHAAWARRFPWLVQGTTGRGGHGTPFDLALFGSAGRAVDVTARWTELRRATGVPRAVHARQVHGAAVRVHGAGEPGLFLSDPCDGHVTGAAGVLLTVTVADCVPVFVVDARRRSVALLHAGWRGAAAGVVDAGLAALTERLGSRAEDLLVHLGPAICGDCYEVGPEVFEGLGLPAVAGPTLLDLRGTLADRVRAAGVGEVTVSRGCTRCGDGHFSHRGGDPERQVGYLGVRP